MKPTFISLFSGVGGFDLGLERAGFECVGQADNDPFCNKVLAKHWPGVKRYDDVRNIGADCLPLASEHGRHQAGTDTGQLEHPTNASRVDLICGGFPCQDLSVAGKRAGLDGARSGLWFEFHRILSELRPTFALIENVPGLLSSNQGRDFGVILAGLGELWPAVGWAILDSQHFGVPQRRRRVYVIAGPSRECVAQILSLCESGDWNTQARRAEREDVTGPVRGRSSNPGVNEPGRGGEDDTNLVLANTLPGHHPQQDLDNDTYVAFGGNRTSGPIDVATALNAHGGPNGRQDFESETFVLAHSLRADGFDASEDGTGRGTPLVAVGYTIHGTDKTARVASETTVAGSIRTKAPDSQENSSTTVALERMGVRRLTPVECARLQGFPDRWTCLCDLDPCKCSDEPQYKAYGNAVSVPVIEYIGRRIAEVLA